MKDTSLCALVIHQGACIRSQIRLTFVVGSSTDRIVMELQARRERRS